MYAWVASVIPFSGAVVRVHPFLLGLRFLTGVCRLLMIDTGMGQSQSNVQVSGQSGCCLHVKTFFTLHTCHTSRQSENLVRFRLTHDLTQTRLCTDSVMRNCALRISWSLLMTCGLSNYTNQMGR